MTPRETFLNDQAAAAHREVGAAVRRLAAEGSYHPYEVRATRWLIDLVEGVLNAPPRAEPTCRHLTRDPSPQPVFLAAHHRRIECAACACRTAQRIKGTREDRTCDVCRRLIPRGQVETFGVAVGAILVTGGHCRGCRAIVRGAEAVA